MNIKNVLVDPRIGDVSIDEMLSDCVAKTNEIVLPALQAFDSTITGVYFQHGHILEIIAQLQNLAKGPATRSQRYPLVALLRDFAEINGKTIGVDEDTVTIIIATRSDPTWFSDKRKAQTFTPILRPIKDEFLRQVELSGNFMYPGEDQLQEATIEHYFWGRESIAGSAENIFNDWIDCIELKNLILKPYTN